MAIKFSEDFAFYEQLKYFYDSNRGKIRSRYNDLTRKFLSYNDKRENPDAYLRLPQFEALEMYIFIKEFMGNPQVYEMFDDWRNLRGKFEQASYYSVNKHGQMRIYDNLTKEVTDKLFKQMKNYRESYPNYIYALTMGLGKTVLMATCIFYEFLLANKYPKSKIYCHNALVFAPDKTVLQSLREIMTFDKTLVVPPEYARILDTNLKFSFLDETGATLNTLDYSDFNIVISNTQKIIVKKKRKEPKPTDVLFSTGSLLSSVYGNDENDDAWDESSLMDNQRFNKLCRLPQLGVYVDEAHHLFGADLEKQILKKTANKTSLRDTINLLSERTNIVACFNYTGTPYVNKQVLPEVVYSYGLKESIRKGYLKDADPNGFENVKAEEFLKSAIVSFWDRYGGKTYEGLNPKLAIYASRVEEAINEVVPVLEKVLAELNIPNSSILVNVGDTKYTKDQDIKNFNDLDVCGSVGNEKQFIVLVDKGKEGWNCRSLFGVAMYRSPSSKVFVLQATMRCLRNISDVQQTATIYLSKENWDVLNDELNKNFNMEIKDMKNSKPTDTSTYKVKVLPPIRKIKLKQLSHKYTLQEKDDKKPISFNLKSIDYTKYESTLYTKYGIASNFSVKEQNIDYIKEEQKFSFFSLTGELSRCLNIPCIEISKLLKNATDGIDIILETVNKYNEIIYDILIPTIFNSKYEVITEVVSKDKDIILLKEPENAGYYEYTAKDNLVITNRNDTLKPSEVSKSFHADTYCFDSLPEKECFLQYITSNKVKEIYFTGMFTANQSELSVQYYDPETGRIRKYYPDFLAKMDDNSYQLIEVKGDNKIDDIVVRAKADAASEMAIASGIEYKIYAGSILMKTNVLSEDKYIKPIDLDLID